MRRRSGHPKIDAWPGVIVASDEVGLGAWAGSLVVCAVAAPVGWDDPRVKDSKKLKIKAKREALYEEFFPDPRFTVSLVEIPVDEIDRMGVGKALPYAHSTALQNVAKRLTSKPLAVVDGSLPVHRWELGLDIVALPKGDQLVPECALASILAKVTRDRMMTELEAKYPGYGFHSHCGYGAAAHEEALQRLGPCPAHRTSYDPIARRIAEREQGTQPKEAWTLLDDE